MKTEYIFAVLGAALLALGAAYPLVTLVVDTTLPSIRVPLCVPVNGGTYSSLDKITAYVYDPESGIQSVTCTIDGTTYTLSYVTTTGSNEVWEYALPSPITASGSHSFSYTATNKAGLSATYSGTFTIYTQLQGKWWINNQEITSTSQTVYSTTATVNFKFQKTAGIEDSKITVTVSEGGTTILTLTLTDATNHIWTGSYTFSSGTHNIEIKAYDGTTTIIYSVVGLTIPGAPSWTITTQQMLILAGIICLAAAGIIHIRKPK